MRVTVDVRRTADGRLEGSLTTDAGVRHAFAGTLDLLRVLEQLDLDPPAPPPDRSAPPDPAEGHAR